MGSIYSNNWYNINSTRKYPLDDGCTGITDEGMVMPATILVDANIRFNRNLGVVGMLSSVKISSRLVSLTFMSVAHPIVSSLYDPPPSTAGGYFKPLCYVTLPKPITTGIPYQVTPATESVTGWVVFGEGVRKNFEGKFSLPIQSGLNPKNCRYYRTSNVSYLAKSNGTTNLQGLVRLVGGANMTITQDLKVVDGITRPVIAFSLKEKNGEIVLNTYRGPCSGRPESNTCTQTSIEFINEVGPDINGNLNIELVSPLRAAYYEGAVGGIAVDYPVGLIDACTVKDRLPDSSGNLPNENVDVCATSESSSSLPMP